MLEGGLMTQPDLVVAQTDPAEVLIAAEDVTKIYDTRAGTVTAVDGVSVEVHRGETLGVVGESGSGKSTLARLLMGLQPPTDGRIVFGDRDLAGYRGKELRQLRQRMQMVFQNPLGSLLPHFSAAAAVMEPLRVHGRGTKDSRRRRAIELLELVGVNPDFADLYPTQFSGGQQQRIAIARALALEPELLVCDEPTSSLDVSIQAQILALLENLKDQLGLSCVFISHNLAVVERLADRVAVMSEGKIVETGETEQLFADPKHPYTRKLLDAVLPVTTG